MLNSSMLLLAVLNHHLLYINNNIREGDCHCIITLLLLTKYNADRIKLCTIHRRSALGEMRNF